MSIRINQHRRPEMFACPVEGYTMHAETIDAAIESVIKGTRENGGHTASAIGRDVPTTGYMVGGYVESLMFGGELITDEGHNPVAYSMMLRWVASHFKIATKESMFLGGWIDTEENVMYVDLSQHFTDLSAALEVARHHEEIAIWDLATSEEIRLADVSTNA